MIFKFRFLILVSIFISGLLFSTDAVAQKACCSKTKSASTEMKACCSSKSDKSKVSGCTPSNCRGAQTKFGEAKVITDLRAQLIALKALMEKANDIDFDERSISVHGLVGGTDDESIQIIIDEVALLHRAFAEVDGYEPIGLEVPQSKARQVQYLSERIDRLQLLL